MLSYTQNGWVGRYAQWIIGHRWWVIVLTLIALLAASSGLQHLQFSNNYRVFFSKENPELRAFEAFQTTYTKNDNILFVVQPADGQVFSPRIGAVIEQITAAAWQIPYTIRVDSISNFQHTWAQTVEGEDELIVEDLLRDSATKDPAWLAERQAVALAEPLLRGALISPKADTAGINVTLHYPEVNNAEEVPAAVAYARAIAAKVRDEHPDLTVALTGFSMLNHAFVEAGRKDAVTLLPLVYVVLVAVMLMSLRSFFGTLATLLVIGFSSLTAMGLAGHLGVKLTPVSVTAPTIILTLAIADSIHILVTMLERMRDGHARLDALKESVRINFLPVSITSLTTAIGFLSLNFSDAPPFGHLGNITAMGITVAWLYSLAFLPALVSLLPLKVRPRRQRWSLGQGLDRLALWVIGNRNKLLVVMGALGAFLIALAPSVQLNDAFVRYFDHRIEFRRHTDFTIQHLNGIYLVEFSVPADEPGGISHPDYLVGLEAFTSWLRDQPEVTHVYSYADIIKRLNRNMHSDEDAWYRIPESRDLAAQYSLLYELSLPYGLDLNDRIALDKSATRVSATVGDSSTVGLRAFLQRAEDWMADQLPPYMVTRATGPSVMFSYISQRNIESMLRGNVLAVVLIALILVVALRSVRLGALSIVPNAVPVLMTFGAWALLVGQVGMAAATVTATSLGIVVDDTVHFLAKYVYARRAHQAPRPQAVRYAFRTVGPAIVITTLILVAGFGILAASTFLINAQMGLLTALAILFALLFDLLMLPALLLLGGDGQPQLVSEKSRELPMA